MWSQRKGIDNYQYDMRNPRDKDDMNDPRDKKLHDCVQRNNQIRREYQAMSVEPVQTNEPVDTDDDMHDEFSMESQLSQ